MERVGLDMFQSHLVTVTYEEPSNTWKHAVLAAARELYFGFMSNLELKFSKLILFFIQYFFKIKSTKSIDLIKYLQTIFSKKIRLCFNRQIKPRMNSRVEFFVNLIDESNRQKIPLNMEWQHIL